MIQPRTIVNIADNSGAKIGRIFKVLGATRKRYARLGEVVVLSVQKAEPRKAIKKKDVLHAVVVRQTQATRRKDGSYIRCPSSTDLRSRFGVPAFFGPTARKR